jgi:hypothetical protein
VKSDIKVVTQRIAALTAKQRAVFLISLCAVLLALAGMSVMQALSIGKNVKLASELASEQKAWLDKSEGIENDISSFGESTFAGSGVDLLEIEHSIEEVITRTCSDYTFERADDAQVGRFTINRLKVSINGVSLANLIDFANEIEAIGNYIAISELKINAMDSGSLAAHAIVSVLNVK